MIRFMLTLASCSLLLREAAAADIVFMLSFPTQTPEYQAIAPGGSGDYAFTVRNTSGEVGDAAVAGLYESRPLALTGYTFTSAEPRCAAPVLETHVGAPSLVFVVGQVGVQESVTCVYRITRSIDSRDDLGFNACGARWSFPICSARFRRGTLPDLALSVEPVTPTPEGTTEAVVRVRLDNLSNRDVASRIASTDCREFEGGTFYPGDFTADTDIAGGCMRANGNVCLNFTGQNFSSYGFRLGPVIAGASASCLVRLHLTQPLTSAYAPSALFSLLDDDMILGDGARAFDPNATNDVAQLGVSLVQGVPVGASALLVLALLIALAGARTLRRNASPHPMT